MKREISRTDPLDWLEAADPQAPFIIGMLSYGELHTKVARAAGALTKLGVKPGDRVAAQLEKSPEALVLYLACLWVGAITMPLNTGYTTSEISYFVEDAEPRLFFAELNATVLPQRVRIVTLSDLEGRDAIARAAADPEDLAAMLYTSGTTGKPKGAMIPRRALADNAATLADLWRVTSADVLLHALPVYHVHGLFISTNTILAAGASMHFLPKFDLDDVLRAMPRCSVMMGVPTFYTRLLQRSGELAAASRNMRLFVSGSAPLLGETHEEFTRVTGHSILERYGMTETQVNTSHPYDGPRLPGTVGVPLPGSKLRITDEQDGIGMIEVRGPGLFKGYWRNPEKTAEDLRADGWFITGDMGRIDENGQLQIVGREKDLIISGGLNVYPSEVETAINLVSGVEESAVIGVAHPDFGEAVVAVVVGSVDEATIRGALSIELARFKRPKVIQIVDALPRNAMGKVQKNVLRERFAWLFEDGR